MVTQITQTKVDNAPFCDCGAQMEERGDHFTCLVCGSEREIIDVYRRFEL